MARSEAMTIDQGGVGAFSTLSFKTSMTMDFEAVARLYTAEGRNAPQAIAAAQDDLDHRLGMVASAHAACDLDAMALSARRIRHLAIQLGLIELRRVSDHVLDCCRTGDPTALAAVMGRLDRLGQIALAQVARLRQGGI